MFGCSFVHITDLHAATISSLRSTFVRFYRGLFIILLFPELSPPITKKCFQIELSCVVENDEKLAHIIRSRAVFIQEPRKFLPIDSNDHQTDSKSLASFLDIAPEIDLNEIPEVLFRTKNDDI